MNEPSNVSLEQHVCPVCHFIYEAGSSRDGRLCPLDDAWLHARGHVAVIECDPERSGLFEPQGVWAQVENAHRTGRIDFLAREKVALLLGLQLAAHQACVFVSPPMLNWLRVVSR